MQETKNKQKIFGIGLNKTGTTTLGQCAKILGYQHTSCNIELLKDIRLKQDFVRIKETVNQFELFENWPWPLIYKELDLMFPGSKFILTTRKDEQIWFNSLKEHSMKTHPIKHCRKLVYGYNFPHKYEQEHLDLYNNHNDEVREYFVGRDNDFIEICWENDVQFEHLCTFLGVDTPNLPLPHANKRENVQVEKRTVLANKLLSLLS